MWYFQESFQVFWGNVASGEWKRYCVCRLDVLKKVWDNSLTGASLAMARGDGLSSLGEVRGWRRRGGAAVTTPYLGFDTQPQTPFSSAQTPRHISQTQLSTWYWNTPGKSASAPLGGRWGWGQPDVMTWDENRCQRHHCKLTFCQNHVNCWFYEHFQSNILWMLQAIKES